jgi:DNA-binding transcriptional LysR family regulator
MSWRRLPPLHAIRAFEAAARHLSVTRAAEELGVTPGAVSRHVRALEASLKNPLFLRRSTGLLLTTAGEDLALAAREGLDRIADAASGVKLRRLRRVSVGIYGFFASRRLLPLWPELRAAHPDGCHCTRKLSIHWGELRVTRRSRPFGNPTVAYSNVQKGCHREVCQNAQPVGITRRKRSNHRWQRSTLEIFRV